MSTPLSPYHLGKARELYNFFNGFNALSWTFLTGNIITLFAMRLKASATFLGTLSALLYMSFFFLPLGKILAQRFSIIRIFSAAWIGRSICMIPLLFVPWVMARGNHQRALQLTFLGVALFHTIRGIGMIGNNPVLSNLATGPDRSGYMTQIQIINSAVGMFAGFIIALLLGRDPPLYLYSIIMLIGIGCGLISGFLMRNIPEPPAPPKAKQRSLREVMVYAFSTPSLRQFILILFLVALVSGVSRSFLIVYTREVFGQSDGLVSLYTVFGGLGTLLIGLMIKLLVRRIGAKPLFIICVITGLVGMISVIAIPLGMIAQGYTLVLLLGFVFFLLHFGFLGSEGIAQTYFLSLVPLEFMLDMGILYFLVFGIAGAGGSLLTGLFLDMLGRFEVSLGAAYKLLYSILLLITLCIIVLQKKLVPLGALPFWGALEVIFSFRDLRAIALLDKLEKTTDSVEEAALLEALHDTPSRLAVQGLLDRIKSPRLAIRMEALRALEALEVLPDAAEQALTQDVIHHPFTTAYISARILGEQRIFAATPLLRELVYSEDYMLAGEAIVALAKLEDEAFRPLIEEIILKTANPRLKIMGVQAFGIYRSPHSLPILLDILRAVNPPPYLRDEVALALANILDMQQEFYPLLVRFLEDPALVPTLALDEVESAYEYYRTTRGSRLKRKRSEVLFSLKQAQALQPAVRALIAGNQGAPLARWIGELPSFIAEPVAQLVLGEVLLDDDLISIQRLRLLIVQWASLRLRALATCREPPALEV
ncbi:MAG: MFS transporter [Spirochaetaceae bacterium]|jgi:HEAT repeat protein|nr:MFS transporter [Spirochaetaceae bacterium]